ncbi:MAG TPA: peptidylprolyl isomerase [Rhodanobacteraceae bacterium]|nr:peptidylprolyl isomerase [Rhodanobacteraceae bacterium]
MSEQPRRIPITIIDTAKPVSQEAREHQHDHADEGPRSLGRPAPVFLYVGEQAISEAEIAQEMQHHRSISPRQSRADAARALVVRELLRREVARLGLDQAPDDGRETPEERGIRLLLEQAVEDRVPSEDDCRRYFEQNAERFKAPDRIRVRHILLAAAANDAHGRIAARTEAERLIEELKANPMLFADFAARHSDCPSKTEGGDLGWLQRGQTTPEFDRQVFRLRAGLAPFPVESRWGYHVVSVDAIAPGEMQDFENARAQIADYLELQVRQRELQYYLLGLEQRYGVRGLAEIEKDAA